MAPQNHMARVGIATLTAALLLAAVGPRSNGAPEVAGVASAEARARPNVVVVLTDDQTVADLRVMRITRRVLVRGGVRFRRFFYNVPICCPSRATMLTGQYAHNTGVRSNHGPNGGVSAFVEAATVATALQADGYRTGFAGKYLNGYPARARTDPTPPWGWDLWFATLNGTMYGFAVNANGRLRRFPPRRRLYKTDILARKGRSFIRSAAAAGRPFFLTMAPSAPHGEPGRPSFRDPRPAFRHRRSFLREPLPRPPSFNERDVSDKPGPYGRVPRLDRRDRRALRRQHRSRLASLLAVDQMVGGLVRELRRTGELRNTYLIFTSDNGYLMGEHRLHAKAFLYEESLRGPLAIRGPGIPRGDRRNQVVSNIDLAPTIFDATGVTPPLTVDGISLLPLVADPEAGRGREILVQARSGIGVRSPGWLYVEHDFDGDGSAEGYELYDMAADPHQLENLIGPDDAAPRTSGPASAARITQKRLELKARLEQLRDCSGTEGPQPCE